MPVSSTAPAISLCSTRGARDDYILQGVCEGVLDERKDEEVEQWTQTLLCLRRTRWLAGPASVEKGSSTVL